MRHFPNCYEIRTTLTDGSYVTDVVIEESLTNCATIHAISQKTADTVTQSLNDNGVRYLGIYRKIDGQLVEVTA